MGETSVTAQQTAARAGGSPNQRFAALVANHHASVWRSLRRLGVWQCDADDAAQQVFLIAHRRLADIAPPSERAFLLQTAVRVAADWRRTRRRQHEEENGNAAEPVDPTANPEELLAQRQARALLDRVLELLPGELRTVFVLFEIEEITMAEISTILEIPAGTVASRLRRARESFRERVKKLMGAKPLSHTIGGGS